MRPAIHPAAQIFPLLGEEQLAALADDIRVNGQRQPVIMLDGAILDGRNRWIACERVGIEPLTVEWDGNGDPIAYVVSLNLHRRHLDESQRAMVAARAKVIFEQSARSRQLAGTSLAPIDAKGKTSDQAAALLNVSGTSVERASRVLRDGVPELATEVDAGRIAVSTAATIAEAPRDEQREIVARGETEILARAKQIRSERHATRETERRQRLRIVTLDEAVKGKFHVIYADPPWQYSNTGFDGSAEAQYPTMATDDICAMPVAERAASNAVLLMWATWPLLEDALRVVDAWGFTYKTLAPWKKHVHVGGFYFLGITEALIVAVRGSCLPNEIPVGFFDYPRSRHSKKPTEFYDLIERMYDGPYLELFARATASAARTGWTLFGNEVVEEAPKSEAK